MPLRYVVGRTSLLSPEIENTPQVESNVCSSASFPWSNSSGRSSSELGSNDRGHGVLSEYFPIRLSDSFTFSCNSNEARVHFSEVIAQ